MTIPICPWRAILLMGTSLLLTLTAESGTLEAGAVTLDITPPADAALPMSGYADGKDGFTGIHDHIYARAIVLGDGSRLAAIMAGELMACPTPFWQRLSQRITREIDIPSEYLLLCAVHDHSAPAPLAVYGNDSPESAAYTKHVEDVTVEAVRKAKENLQPAKIGIKTGNAYVNVNGREHSPDTGWWLGYNPEGPSGKTVTVIRFDAVSGKPIALLINYAVHAVVMGAENHQVSGDLARATSRYVENYYRGKADDAPRSDAGAAIQLRPDKASDGVVALWTSGAAGDQNSISLARGADFTMVESLGKILGEKAVRVAASIRAANQVRIWGKQQVISCPGRTVEPSPLPRKEYKWQDSAPVSIRLSLLMVNDIVLAGVSGEVMTMIHEHLKKESPFSRTVTVTHANGSSGYIPDDAAFNPVSYEITASRLKPGCAENAIVNRFLQLVEQH